MPFQFDKTKMYLMPVVFGPCNTPRQIQDGGSAFDEEQPTHSITYSVAYETNPDKIEKILPEGFELLAPYVLVGMTMHKNISWLAGFGYNFLNVRVPVRFRGKEDVKVGKFQPVVWESHADPCLSGREQLGFSKIYSEIDDISTYHGVSRTAMRSWGHTFFEMEIYEKEQPENLEEFKSIYEDPNEEGIMHLKYISNTDDFTKPDVCYAVIGGGKEYVRVNENAGKWPADKVSYMRGTLSWFTATWNQMPTQYRIAQTLADWEIKRFIGAARMETYYFDDSAGHTILK